MDVIEIEPAWQRPRGIEFAVSDLRESILLEAFRGFALAFDHELIILHGDMHVLLGYAGQNGAQVQVTVVPARFHDWAERPGTLPGRVGSGGLRRTIEVFKHLVHRTSELIQRLSNIASEHCAQ